MNRQYCTRQDTTSLLSETQWGKLALYKNCNASMQNHHLELLAGFLY